MRGRWLVALAPIAIAAPRIAHAQEDVPALIKLLDEQPAGMDRAAWKEKRREVARKLVASGDKRAVPVLMKVAASETFDIIGEVAIEGLGTLGDPQAVPTLQQIEADPSRDAGQRTLARKALARLGAKPGAPAGGGAGSPSDDQGATGGDTRAPAGDTGGAGDTGAALVTAPGPGLGAVLAGRVATPAAARAFADDTLAEAERITFAVGGARLSYDSVRSRTGFDGDVAAHYARRVDREHMAWGYGGDLAINAGYVNPDGPQTSRALTFDLGVRGDGRAYFGPGVYGTAIGELAHRTQYVSSLDDMGQAITKDTRFATELQLGLGVGWGRVLDVGARVRVRRIEAVLAASRSLGRPIDAALARTLQATWWSQRGARSAHPMLVATIQLLREAGVLLGEPDAGTSFELLEVLRDGGLDDRRAGFDVQLIFGEGYLRREDDPPVDEGRVEQLIVRAAYARQLPGDTSDLTADLVAKRRMFPGDMQAAPWVATAGARWRRFVYTDHAEPRGALDLGAQLGASDDDRDDTDLGFVIGGEIGWSFRPNRGSWLRVGADARLDSGELFLGATLEASYGLLAATFAR